MLCSNACTISLQYINNVVTGIDVHEPLIAQMVEVWAGELELQVQDTSKVLFQLVVTASQLYCLNTIVTYPVETILFFTSTKDFFVQN